MQKICKTIVLFAFLTASADLVAADADPLPAQPGDAAATDPAAEVAVLQAQIAGQQKQIEQLKSVLEDQQKALERLAKAMPLESSRNRQAPVGQIASATPMIVGAPISSSRPSLTAAAGPLSAAVPAQASQAAAPAAQPAGPTIAEVSGRLAGYIRNVVRISGDMRFRYDLQARSSNDVAGPLQNSRERYRLRLNFDKDLFRLENSSGPFARFHAQLSTDPFNNPITMDTDFSGIDTRAPISVAEAWIDVLPVKGLTLRVGRIPEIYADNRQFVWDDDVRFNGFNETYRYTAKNAAYIEVKAGQYILTNPNVPIVPAMSPYLAAGYSLGQRVPSAAMFDQGITVGADLNKKWTINATTNYNVIREPNQIQLASTAAGFPLLESPILGATLIGALPQVGNATTTNGGAMYFAEGFHVIRGAVNLNFSGSPFHGHNFPFQLFLQGTHNTKASIDPNAYSLGANFGQAPATNSRLGDVQVQYQYFYKGANAFVSQFTDDDVGTGSGTNVKVHHIRLNFGINRFLVWENRVFFQKGISRSNPAINYFVPLQQGYNLSTRFQSQFLFTF